MKVHFSLYGRMLSLQALDMAYKQVKKNRGAAGIDGQSIDDFTQNLEKELKQLLLELKEKCYQAHPVTRVKSIKMMTANDYWVFQRFETVLFNNVYRIL